MTRSSTIANESRGIQSVETAYRVLVAIQVGTQPVALKDIAKRAHISPSQAHNYLSSLVRTGMVQAAGRGSYRLGAALAALGMSAMTSLDRYELVRDAATSMAEQTTLGVAVSRWSDLGPVVVFNRSGSPWGMFDLRNGLTSIVWTAAGNVFIAFDTTGSARTLAMDELREEGRSDSEAQDIVESIVDRVKTDGFAFQLLAEMPGYGALSAPVWNENEQVAYCVTLTGPKAQIDTSPDGPHIPLLLATARELTHRFGGPARFWADPGALG